MKKNKKIALRKTREEPQRLMDPDHFVLLSAEAEKRRYSLFLMFVRVLLFLTSLLNVPLLLVISHSVAGIVGTPETIIVESNWDGTLHMHNTTSVTLNNTINFTSFVYTFFPFQACALVLHMLIGIRPNDRESKHSKKDSTEMIAYADGGDEGSRRRHHRSFLTRICCILQCCRPLKRHLFPEGSFLGRLFSETEACLDVLHVVHFVYYFFSVVYSGFAFGPFISMLYGLRDDKYFEREVDYWWQFLPAFLFTYLLIIWLRRAILRIHPADIKQYTLYLLFRQFPILVVELFLSLYWGMSFLPALFPAQRSIYLSRTDTLTDNPEWVAVYNEMRFSFSIVTLLQWHFVLLAITLEAIFGAHVIHKDDLTEFTFRPHQFIAFFSLLSAGGIAIMLFIALFVVGVPAASPNWTAHWTFFMGVALATCWVTFAVSVFGALIFDWYRQRSAMVEEEAYTMFLSHKWGRRVDSDHIGHYIAHGIATRVRQLEPTFKIWLDEEILHHTDHYIRETMRRGIDKSKHFICLLTHDYLKQISDERDRTPGLENACFMEFNHALQHKGRQWIKPVLVQEIGGKKWKGDAFEVSTDTTILTMPEDRNLLMPAGDMRDIEAWFQRERSSQALINNLAHLIIKLIKDCDKSGSSRESVSE